MYIDVFFVEGNSMPGFAFAEKSDRLMDPTAAIITLKLQRL